MNTEKRITQKGLTVKTQRWQWMAGALISGSIFTLLLFAALGAQAQPAEVGVQANTGGWSLQASSPDGIINQSGGATGNPELAGNTVATANLSESDTSGGDSASINWNYTAQMGQLSSTLLGTLTSDHVDGYGGEGYSYTINGGGAYFADYVTIYNPGLATNAPVPVTMSEVVNWIPNVTVTIGANPGPSHGALYNVYPNQYFQIGIGSGTVEGLSGNGDLTDYGPNFTGDPSNSTTFNVPNGTTYWVEGGLVNNGSGQYGDGDDGSYSSSIVVNDYLSSSLAGTTIISESGHNYLPPPPTLTIQLAGNSVIVSWPDTASYTLQQNSNLATGSWVTSGYTINTSNGTNSITITPSTGNLFFRLYNP
jgi:hypothetical protein